MIRLQKIVCSATPGKTPSRGHLEDVLKRFQEHLEKQRSPWRLTGTWAIATVNPYVVREDGDIVDEWIIAAEMVGPPPPRRHIELPPEIVKAITDKHPEMGA